MNQAIINFVEAKRIAILGVSRSGKKFGNTVYSELKDRGYQVYIVHPQAQDIGGEPCYPNITALVGKVDGAFICLPPAQAKETLRDVAQAGISKIWLQQGSDTPEVLALARELGVDPVHGKCILMYAQPVKSFHGWHRAFASLFGQL